MSHKFLKVCVSCSLAGLVSAIVLPASFAADTTANAASKLVVAPALTALTSVPAATATVVTTTATTATATANTAVKQQAPYQVIALADMLGVGETAVGAALEYPTAVDAASLSPADFSVPGQTITSVYTNDKAAMTDKNVPGRYVILQFAQEKVTPESFAANHQPPKKDNKNGQGNQQGPNGPQGKQDAPMFSDRVAPDVNVAVSQVGAVDSTKGQVFKPTNTAVKSSSVYNPILAKFTQHVFKDPETGESITYDLYLPDGYDKNKKYPLVFFMADASANNGAPLMAVLQGNGAAVWASPEEQKKHPAIIVAPEYTPTLIRTIGMATDDTNTWTKGLTLVSNMLFDVIDKIAERHRCVQWS
jgi:predicted peptidase